ncbi:MAG: DNA polymerase Y family protein [Micrococcales bacterium]|nr:DNA polymerase Y family protein [Micrococcales bacterium]MCL2666236.1 DNA polymerase Y family protein [Micrococcales bacterium]
MNASSTRTTVVWVPDWPVVAAMAAAGVDAHVPAAVHDGRRVVVTSATARAAGVRRGMRRRLAQGCCPQLVLLARDPAQDIAFEQVARACEQVVAGVEVVRPGMLLLPAGGAARYHGSEQTLADALVEAVAVGTGHECGVGTADGLLAAVLAARTGAVVPAGGSAGFLADQPVGSLLTAVVDDSDEVDDLVGLLVRLGLRTLGAFAALPHADVAARFGRLGIWAHTLASGRDIRPPARRRVEPDLVVGDDLDPPVERADQTAFAGRRLAERLHTLLVTRGLSCGRLRICARTDGGTELARVWHADTATGGLSPARITDRVRWQTEGWLTHDGPDSGLVRLEIAALDVVVAGAQQPGLWGAASGADVRAHRALDRVQQLVGDQVFTARLQGGRDPAEQVHLVAWGSDEPSDRPLDRPWPGRLPDPVPSSVLTVPRDVTLLDASGRPVLLDERGWLDGTPVTVVPGTSWTRGLALGGWGQDGGGQDGGDGSAVVAPPPPLAAEPRDSRNRPHRPAPHRPAQLSSLSRLPVRPLASVETGVRDSGDGSDCLADLRRQRRSRETAEPSPLSRTPPPTQADVVGWSGPWPSPPRWWREPVPQAVPTSYPGSPRHPAVLAPSPAASVSQEPVTWSAHMQVLTSDDRVLLVAARTDGWTWVATYD